VQREDIEEVVVGRRFGVGADHLEQPVEILGAPGFDVVPVGQAGEVDRHLRVVLLHDEVGDFEQAVVILDRALELVAVDAHVDVGLVPDDPAVDAAHAVIVH